MRGTLRRLVADRVHRGIIPAYAGNTLPNTAHVMQSWDHPRVCGEHEWKWYYDKFPQGSSPRMRGTLHVVPIAQDRGGIIPAYAGNTGTPGMQGRQDRDHPRVCGEHRHCLAHRSTARGSSPRMRGTHLLRLIRNHRAGIIPAYAGNTLRDYSNFVVSKFMSFVFHLV